jgi:rfaE bifunctional protein nucleotidyltransferase chain/domain
MRQVRQEAGAVRGFIQRGLSGVTAGLKLRPVFPQQETKNVVLAHGCFDLLHLGHIRHLQEARKMGDRLVVSVTPDMHVGRGVNRPVFSAAERAEALRALDCVDEVVINDTSDAVSAIERFKPSVYVKGSDYHGVSTDKVLDLEVAAVEKHGGKFVTTRAEAQWSSSRIINGQRFSGEVCKYLDEVRKDNAYERICAAFDRTDALQIAFIGEQIVDEYRYIDALAKPSKEFIVAGVAADKPTDAFLGGIDAAAAQCEWKHTSVITDTTAPIKKTRFVDPTFNRKLFEVYSARELFLDEEERQKFRSRIAAAVGSSDVVVVLDFGHGLIGQPERNIMYGAKFLAVNAQTNAGNAGFNLITKYKRAHYVCIDVPEARLAVGEQHLPPDDMCVKLSSKVACCKWSITHGAKGSSYFEFLDNYREGVIPALATRAVDTMGAGDAYLAASAPLLAAGLSLDLACFVGSVAAAIKVDILGHSRCVERRPLVQTIQSLLK